MQKVICFTNGGKAWYYQHNLSNVFYFNFDKMTFVNYDQADLSDLDSYAIEGNSIPDYCVEIACKEFNVDSDYIIQRLEIQEIEGL